jgi:hypothetical protein
MFTIACLLAMQVVGLPSVPPNWNYDYELALQRAGAANKPVAVFIGTGKDGWKAICEEGDLGQEARRLLAEHYVCVYVDASRAAQKELVQSFEADRSPLVVLSTRDRAYQAYRHSGALGNASLAKALRRYATEEAASPQVSAPAGNVVYYEVPCRT